jgi:hypothetical protein
MDPQTMRSDADQLDRQAADIRSDAETAAAAKEAQAATTRSEADALEAQQTAAAAAQTDAERELASNPRPFI